MDIYIWISIYRYPCIDILTDIHMQHHAAIFVSIYRYPYRYPYATSCSHLCQGVCYCLVLPFAQVRAPQAPAQKRRAPTIGPALLPTCSGPAPTRLLSYDAVTRGRTGKKTNVSSVLARVPKSIFPQHRTREWGHWCPSEHSLIDTRGRPSSIL